MTKLICSISDLEEVCRLVSLKGKNPQGKEYTAIPDFLVEVHENVETGKGLITTKAVDNKGAIAVGLEYNVPKVEVPGLIPIGDVEKFQKYLSRFNSSDEVIVETTENKILIVRPKPHKVARIPMASVDSLSSNKNAETILNNFQKTPEGYYKSSKTFLNLRLTLNADDVKNVIGDGEVVGQRIYPWKLADGLTIKVGTEQLGEIETQINLLKVESNSDQPTNTKTAFAYGIDNIFNNLSGEVTVYLANQVEVCPLILEQKTEKYSLKILLAPVMVEQ